jgi:hypothetical protein
MVKQSSNKMGQSMPGSASLAVRACRASQKFYAGKPLVQDSVNGGPNTINTGILIHLFFYIQKKILVI